MLKRLQALIIGLFILVCARAQTKINLYYTESKSDTISDIAAILSKELGKTGEFSFSHLGEKLFSGKGILLSYTAKDWPVEYSLLRKKDIEAVIVKSDRKGSVKIIGNSQMAVRNGVFIYLEAIGFRYYFPHPDWYIIPGKINLFPAINYSGEPSFNHRRIWYGYGTVGYAAATASCRPRRSCRPHA